MQRCEDNVAARLNGNALQPLSDVSVTVTDDHTGLPAALYSDNGVTQVFQPLKTDDNGYYGFYAANGEYTLTFSGIRIATFTRKVVLNDFDDNPAVTKAELAAGSGSSLVTFTQAGAGSVPQDLQALLRASVSVRQFGARGDGVTDDTAAIQAALDYAALKGMGVYAEAGNYRLSKARIKNGCRSFWTDSATLTAITASHEGVIELDGTFFSTTAVSACQVFGFRIDGAGVARRGIFAATAINCAIFNNSMSNMSGTAPEGGIALHFNSTQNRVYGNRVELPIGPDCVGIFCISQTVDQYAGWMNGAISTPTSICSHNAIFGNYIDGGSHGISLFGARFCNIENNIVRGQRDRGIILSPAASYNTVVGNSCLDFGSTGIHMAYGSNFNLISANSINSLGSTGEAGMQAYVACSSNKFDGNTIICASRYGIYLAVDATYNEVLHNRITGNLTKAAIAIDSDWSGSLPAGAPYSRPNYAAPTAPRTNWPNDATYGNVIKANTMIDLPSGVAAIALAQIGANAANQDNLIEQNVVNGSTPAHYLHVFEATGGKSISHVVTGNRFKQFDPSRISLTRGRAHLKSCTGNSIMNETGTFYDYAATATLDVGAVDCVSTAAFASATTITNFPNGMDGQGLQVRMSVNTTIQANANIKLKGGVNASGGNANDFMTFRRLNGVWVERSRTF